MRISLFAMLAFVVALVGLALWRGEGTLALGLRTAGSQGIRFVPIMIAAFVIMGLTEVLLPEAVVEAWLSDAAGLRGIGVAWLAGILTPGGSLVGMPLAFSLHKLGVSAPVLITYLTSLALLSVVRIPIELGFLGPRLTALRVSASLLLPPIAGLLARFVAPVVGLR